MYYEPGTYTSDGMSFQPITPNWQGFMEPPTMGALGQEEVLEETEIAGNGYTLSPALRTAWAIASYAAMAAGVFHGYKRSARHPVWSALGYGLLGGALPIIGIPVMLAQGFAKPKGR